MDFLNKNKSLSKTGAWIGWATLLHLLRPYKDYGYYVADDGGACKLITANRHGTLDGHLSVAVS